LTNGHSFWSNWVYGGDKSPCRSYRSRDI